MPDIQGFTQGRVESCVETFLSLYLYYNIFTSKCLTLFALKVQILSFLLITFNINDSGAFLTTSALRATIAQEKGENA